MNGFKTSFALVGAMGAAIISGSAVAQHYVIRLDPATKSAEVRIDDADGEGYSYETLFPSGSIRSGVWDVVLDKVGGPLEGIRVLTFPEQDEDGELRVQFVHIEIYRKQAPYPEDTVRRVPDRFLADLTEGRLEPSWITVEQKMCHIGTHREDDDPDTIPAFTLMCNGELRECLWEENLSGKPTPILGTVWPFGIERQADGSIWFVQGNLSRTSSHGTMPEDYSLKNHNTKTLPITLSSHTGQP